MDQAERTLDQAAEAETAPRIGRFALPPAFRYPAYRVYWGGTLASVVGYQVFQFTQFLLVHRLTGSAVYLGLVGLAAAIPALALNLFGGVVADKMDKRKLLLTTQVTNAVFIAVLGTLTLLDMVEPWHVVLIAFLSGAVFAFDNPARQSLYPLLVARSALTSAVAFQSVIWQSTRIAAPALAGLVVAFGAASEQDGMAVGFFLASAGFAIMGVVMARLKMPASEQRRRTSGLQDLAEGLHFIRTNTVVLFLMLMSFVNGLFGGAYLILMPVIARDILGVGADLQGWMLSAGGIGAVSVTLFVGSRSGLHWRTHLLVGGATLYGVLIAVFAITAERVGSYPLAVGLIVAMGASQAAYMLIIMSSLQMLVPDRLRGRVMGFFGVTYAMLPLSGLLAGLTAQFVGVPVAVAIGGLIVSIFALGPALLNAKIRNLGANLAQAETAVAA